MTDFKPFSCPENKKTAAPFKFSQVCELQQKAVQGHKRSNSTENSIRQIGGGNEREYVMLLHNSEECYGFLRWTFQNVPPHLSQTIKDVNRKATLLL